MMKSMCLVVLFVFVLISIQSESRSITHKPHPNLNFKINSTGHQSEEECMYVLTFKTSCDSRTYTMDKITIRFGDLCNCEVGPIRIDSPSEGRFVQCMTDNVYVYGRCVSDICYVKFYRSGSYGWKLKDLYINRPFLYQTHFAFNEWIPGNIWDGKYKCPKFDPDDCSKTQLA